MYCSLIWRDFAFIEHYFFYKIAILTKQSATIWFKLLESAYNNILPWLFKFPQNRRNRNPDTFEQACPIITTCSSRESGDSTRASRTSRNTMVTSGSICSSRDMVFFSEIKWSVTCRCISLRQGPTQLARVVRLVQVVKRHLINKGRGPVNSYESFHSFKWWNCI